MCGIVGYVGSEQCAPILARWAAQARVPRLRLSRPGGADAQGHPGGARRRQAAQPGEGAHREAARWAPPASGHTRWATHGRPSEVNAHPHVAGGIARRAQRHHREPPRAARPADQGRAEDRQRHRHRARRAPGRTSRSRQGHDLEAALRTRTEAGARRVRHRGGQRSRARTRRRRQGWPRRWCSASARAAPSCARSDIPALLPFTRDVIIMEDGELAVLELGTHPHHHARRQRRSSAPRAASTGRPRRPRRAASSTSCSRRSTSSRAPWKTRCAGASTSRTPTSTRAEIGLSRRDRQADQARVPARLRHEPPRRHGRAATTSRASRKHPRARSSWPASSARASRSSARATWWSRSASRARPPTRWLRCARPRSAARRVLAIANVIGSAIPRDSDAALLHARRPRDRRGVAPSASPRSCARC